MKKNFRLKIILILIFSFFLLIFLLKTNITLTSLKVFIFPNPSDIHKKFWVGEKHGILISKFPENSNEKIYFRSLNNKVGFIKGYLLMKSSGRECLTAYSKKNKKIKSTVCFIIYNTPELNFKEHNPIKIEIYTDKQLKINCGDYPKSNIKYHSSLPEIIKINNEGIITAMRPGTSIITASGLDFKSVQINVSAISNYGLIRNYTLDIYNAEFYQNLMVVSHPDDETLWGGSNLFKDSFFVVCLTNGYNLERANDFKQILKFTHNGGMILNYPDLKDNSNIQDDWSDVKNGILKDLSTILNYKDWNKIVTHGPDGTTGHPHHKKACELVTKIVKEYNKYNRLYYFSKFYPKNEIPKYLPRISDDDLKIKIKEVFIYKSVRKIIYRTWFHMLPYENWILASNWKN